MRRHPHCGKGDAWPLLLLVERQEHDRAQAGQSEDRDACCERRCGGDVRGQVCAIDSVDCAAEPLFPRDLGLDALVCILETDHDA